MEKERKIRRINIGYWLKGGGFSPDNKVVVKTAEHLWTLWKLYVFVENGDVSEMMYKAEMLNICPEDVEKTHNGLPVFRTKEEANKAYEDVLKKIDKTIKRWKW